jgi:hypothetical protein
MPATAPLWIAPVFLGLVAAGAAQARPRTVRPGLGAALGLFLFSLWGVVSAFGGEPAALAAWAAGIAASLVAGDRVFVPRGLVRVGRCVRIPGSWLPLALLMGLFAVKCLVGFAVALGWPVAHDTWFRMLASLALGVASGGFTARAVALHAFAARQVAAA